MNISDNFVGVERVGWLSELEHHEVGDVDDVVDRTNADAFDLGAQPLRAGPDFHIVDLASGEKWTFARRTDGHASLLDGDLRFARRRFELFPGERCDFARQSEMAEQIAAIRRDLDVENGVSWKKIGNRGADF